MAVFSGHWWYAWWPFTNQYYFQWQWGKPLTSAFDYGVKVMRESQHVWLLPHARKFPDSPGQIQKKERKLGLPLPASLNR